MNNSAYFSHKAPVFHGRKLPEDGFVVGYASIINRLKLTMPMPGLIAMVCNQNKKYQNEEWKVFPKRYLPEDHKGLTELEALYKQLVFAMKYEGVNLLLFSFLIQHYSKAKLTELLNIEPTGQYTRRIWFIIEWILGEELEGKENMTKKSYVPVVDIRHQYAVEGEKSPRHLVINNLPGTPDFCPLITRTDKLEQCIQADLSKQKYDYLKGVRKDIVQRASAFMLLKDSKASFAIEGENPKSKRALRWGQAIDQAGIRDLSIEELNRLQQVVIENPRFMTMGLRKKGGFVGEHDRTSGEPIPDHISAKWQDVEQLIRGLIQTNELLIKSDMDAVLTASVIAFGFIFIHPFVDGNGRIHRYLIHHSLAKKQFSHQGVIFPVSASILDHIDDYRKVLEFYSHPLLDFIEWEETKEHNVNVLNETINYYRYFDVTKHSEFLYDCVIDTINNIIPNEVQYLSKYDEFKRFLDNNYEMPDSLVALLLRFLEQNNGLLSKRAREKEFASLTVTEIEEIENQYLIIFH